ncbi:MAG TPA: MarR family transcriptional regulator [Thermoanaerobaculia bacterium]|nr:MarR family transcriptional regulator [Thermoanaerobaculia bacterium]
MPDRDLVSGVVQLANLLTRRLAPVFERAKITPQQWGVLSALGASDGPMTLAGLARTMLVSKQNMTGMIARLEQLGLAERSDDPNDLRSSRVVLTRRGRSVVEKLRPAYEEWLAAVSGESEREIATLTRSIDRLIGRLQASDEQDR